MADEFLQALESGLNSPRKAKAALRATLPLPTQMHVR